MNKKHDDLTKKDFKYIDAHENSNPVIRYLQNRENLKFQIGDVLVREKQGWGQDAKWVTESVSGVSKAPKKFVYVAENEFGVGYVKQLKASGKGFTDGEVICLANVDFTRTRFTVDPDYQDHILLDAENKFEYDSKFKEDKRKRQATLKENKKLLEPTKTWLDVENLAKKLTVGQTMWMGWDIYTAAEREFTVKEVKFLPGPGMNPPRWNENPSDGTSNVKVNVIVQRMDTYSNSLITEVLDTYRMLQLKVMLTKPKSFDEKI